MRVDAFDFELSAERIALKPADPRDSARMLVVPSAGPFIDDQILGLSDRLRPGDVVVINDTRVIKAQLTGRRGDARISVTLHQYVSPGCWRAFAKPLKRLRTGDQIYFNSEFSAHVQTRNTREVTLDFGLSDKALREKLEAYGELPLPPYIQSKRKPEAADLADYQTIYAAKDGAVAAPTAGLHFTERLFHALRERDIGCEALTLHVGAGTFLPVTADDTDDHVMHRETITVSEATATRLNRVRREGGRVIAVGTTSLRSLESCADAAGCYHAFQGDTDLFITPGYRFRGTDGLLTNFHLPRSTLFMLVAAFSGLQRMQQAYAHAIAAGYRFYSFGDACLLWPIQDRG